MQTFKIELAPEPPIDDIPLGHTLDECIDDIYIL